MPDIVKPGQRIPIADTQGNLTLPWDNFMRQVAVDKPNELQAQITTNQTTSEGLAIEMAFND